MSVFSLTTAPALSGAAHALSGAFGSVHAVPGASFLIAGQSTPAPPPAPASGQEFGSASTLGFVVLVLFFIAVAFLARSMAKHLKRVQKPFQDAEEAALSADSDPASDSALAESPVAPDPDDAPAATPAKQHKADA